MNHHGILRKVCILASLLGFAATVRANDRNATNDPPGPVMTAAENTASDPASHELTSRVAFPAVPMLTASEAVPFPPPSTDNDANKWQFSIYPILGWAPLFRANTDFSLPDFPNGGGTGAGATNWSLNGAALFGVDVMKSGWVFEAEGMWASVSASQPSPYVNVSTSVSYGDLFVGHKVWKDFSLLAGFRRMAVNADITVTDFPPFSRKPGVWDPLVGVDWRRKFGRKLFVQIRADGGGFGVGSDVDVDLEARVEWRFAKHFGLLGGYEALHYQISGTVYETVGDLVLKHPWQLRQTYNGPLMGFGIYF